MVGCDAELDFDGPSSPTPPQLSLMASFDGTIIPTLVAPDGICKVRIEATSTGGVTPYVHEFDSSIFRDADRVIPFEDGTGIDYLLSSSFSSTIPYTFDLMTKDSASTTSQATTARTVDCTGDEAIAFVG
jgi:hypothetical protein